VPDQFGPDFLEERLANGVIIAISLAAYGRLQPVIPTEPGSCVVSVTSLVSSSICKRSGISLPSWRENAVA
jgi:hypothetical protein